MTTIYRLIAADEWKAAQHAGGFSGSPHDLRDGFIHFSTAAQVAETAAKHYAGQRDLLLLYVTAEALRDPLKWEVSRGDQLFPHLYGTLPIAAVRRVERVPMDGERHVLPDLDP